MRRTSGRLGSALCVASLALLTGCAQDHVTVVVPSSLSTNRVGESKSNELESVTTTAPIQLASNRSTENLDPKQIEQRIGPSVNTTGSVAADIFAGESTLTPAHLVQIVLKRNPTLDQMRAAAAAAESRYPQATSLDDPMFAFTTAPGSAWSNNVNYAARVELTQKLPWSGKRELRGQVASAEASAAAREVDDAQLQLIESALSAFAQYSFTLQALVVNTDNLDALENIRKDAAARVKNQLAPQQDLLQADVEIARQKEHGISLERMSRVAKAKLNTLMHLPPDAPIPPPEKAAQATAIANVSELRAKAVASRPDLKILADRIAAEEASLALMIREYKPDVELMAAYDGFWQGENGRPLQWQVGAKINLPIRTSRRDAAVAGARARVAERRAELARMTDQVNLQVQESFELLQESEKIIQLYDNTLLPKAEANLKEARASYVNSKIPFVSLAEAQRTVVSVKERYFEALADALRRRAALERAVGGAIENEK